MNKMYIYTSKRIEYIYLTINKKLYTIKINYED